MTLDKDLLSIQQARNLAAKAKEAQLEYKHFSQQQVDKIVKAMAEAGYSASEKLAKMACDESGFGVYEDKIIKNQFSTKNVYESIKNLKTVGIVAEEANGKVLKIAEPMGVVCALIPSTNPTSTAMFKALISLKSRNAIVASPHPQTAKCTAEAVKILSEASEKKQYEKIIRRQKRRPTGCDSALKVKLAGDIPKQERTSSRSPMRCRERRERASRPSSQAPGGSSSYPYPC